MAGILSQIMTGGCVLAVLGVGYAMLDHESAPEAPAPTAPRAATEPVEPSQDAEQAVVGVPSPSRRPHRDVVAPKTNTPIRSAQEMARLRALHEAAAESEGERRVFSPARPLYTRDGQLRSPVETAKPPLPVASPSEQAASGSPDAVRTSSARTVVSGEVKTNAATGDVDLGTGAKKSK